MPIEESVLRQMLEEEFASEDILIKDLVGDRDHYEVTITSERFNGLSMIKQHQMVMAALKGKLGNELHALSIKTKVR